MPHEMMNTMHEAGMPGSHHWMFWVMIAVGFSVVAFLVWWFGVRNKKEQ